MRPMETLLLNKPLFSALIAVIVAQLLKSLVNYILYGDLTWKGATSTGGMPSSHSATVAALTTSIGMLNGVNSYEFAISIVFSIIVIYDAVGVRQAAGKHAEVINEWSKILSEAFEHGFQPENLKTLLGHTVPQVTAGTLLGILIGFLYTFYM